MPPDSNTSAFDVALTNFADMVRRVAWRHRLSDADVDEVLQEVRIRIWKATGGAEGSSEQLLQSPASYVYRTAVSAAIDLIRKQRSERARSTIPLGEEANTIVLETAPTAQAALEGAELAEQVARAIEAITESRRPAVRMYLAGYSREDIAGLMGWTEAKTRNLLYRGLDDLRRELAAMGIERESYR